MSLEVRRVVWLADFWIVSALVWVAVTVFVSVGEFTASVPKNPWAEATFVTLPVRKTAGEGVWVEVGGVSVPEEDETSVRGLGDRLVRSGGQDSSVVLLSVTVNGPDRVMLSVLMTL